MAEYSNIIGRAEVSDAMLPPEISKEIIQEAPKSSVFLSRARRVALTKKEGKQPILSSMPSAYWINGDTGLVQTDEVNWGDQTITAEDLGLIIPIPLNVLNDSDVPLWDEVKPLMVEAVGAKVDGSALFGVDKPDTWPDAVIPAAISCGNTVVRGTHADLGADVAGLCKILAQQGYGVNGFASKPGMQWELVGLRNAQGDPIYTQSLAGRPESGLYGYPLNETDNGSWDMEKADLVAADWKKMVVGIRQDISYDLYKECVISDANGKIVLNLMQQRCAALMVTMRIGFQVAKPLTRLGGKYPAGVIVPAASSASVATFSAERPDAGDDAGAEAGDGPGAVAGLESMGFEALKSVAADMGIDTAGMRSKAEVRGAIEAASDGGE